MYASSKRLDISMKASFQSCNISYLLRVALPRGSPARPRTSRAQTSAETTEPIRGAKGHRITTHWGYIEALRGRAEDTTVLARNIHEGPTADPHE